MDSRTRRLLREHAAFLIYLADEDDTFNAHVQARQAALICQTAAELKRLGESSVPKPEPQSINQSEGEVMGLDYYSDGKNEAFSAVTAYCLERIAHSVCLRSDSISMHAKVSDQAKAWQDVIEFISNPTPPQDHDAESRDKAGQPSEVK